MIIFRKILDRRNLKNVGACLQMQSRNKSNKSNKNTERVKTSFTPIEIEAFREIYNRYECKDYGSMDKWQFNNFIRATLGRRINVVDLHRIFVRIDSNKDERISFDELLSHLERRLSPPSEMDLRRAFNYFDKDNNGRLMLGETRLALLFLGEDYGHSDVRNIFIKFDKDNDGEINYNDFVKLVLEEVPRLTTH